MSKTDWLYLIVITLIAGLLRLYLIDQFPIGFTADEASHGYDAFSLIQTGQDQWGHSWPIAFQSFGDWKLPVYTYLSLIPIYLTGLSVWSTRLVGAIVGSLTIPTVFFLTKELFHSSQKYKLLPYWAALVVTLSPWHIQLSRGAYEANLTSFFLPLALWLTLIGIRSIDKLKFNWYWLLASFSLIINLYTYHAARLATVFIGFIIITYVYYRLKDWSLILKKGWPAAVLTIIFCLPIAYSIVNGGGSRAWDVAVFNPTDNWKQLQDSRHQLVIHHTNPLIARILYNKLTYSLAQITTNYISYISPRFLIITGAGESTYGMISGMGVIHITSYFFLLISGFYALTKKNPQIILLWAILLAAIIPAALSKGNGFAANRAATMLPWIQILIAAGIVYSTNWIKTKVTYPFTTKLVTASFLAIYLLSTAYFLARYFFRAPYDMASAMSYGWDQVIAEINQGRPQSIYLDRNFTEPHIFPMFYQQIDPLLVQQQSPDWNEYQRQGFAFVDMLPQYQLDIYTVTHVIPDEIPYRHWAIVKYNPLVPIEKFDKIIYKPGYPEPIPYIVILKR